MKCNRSFNYAILIVTLFSEVSMKLPLAFQVAYWDCWCEILS